MKKNRLTLYVLIAMVAGIVMEYTVHQTSSFSFQQLLFAQNVKLPVTIFIRLIRAIIAPLVFSTLVVGIAKLVNLNVVRKVSEKALRWFVAVLIITAICFMFKIPPEGVVLILLINRFGNMLCWVTRVSGNALAAIVVGKQEGELQNNFSS